MAAILSGGDPARYRHVLDDLPLHDAYVLLHANLLSRGVRVISPASRAAALAAADAQIRAALTTSAAK